MGKVNQLREEEWEAKAEDLFNGVITETEFFDFAKSQSREHDEISGVLEEYNRQNEEAYERYCARYYGGEVETVDEAHRKAWEQKQELKR